MKKPKCYTSRKTALRVARKLNKIVVPSERIIERKNPSTGRTRILRQPLFCLARKPKNYGKCT